MYACETTFALNPQYSLELLFPMKIDYAKQTMCFTLLKRSQLFFGRVDGANLWECKIIKPARNGEKNNC